LLDPQTQVERDQAQLAKERSAKELQDDLKLTCRELFHNSLADAVKEAIASFSKELILEPFDKTA
jgi:hypothetical protein